MPVTIVKVTDSKSGKAKRVQIGNQWYGANKDCGLTPGMVIEPQIETGDFGPWIKKWLPAQGTTIPDTQDERNPPPEGATIAQDRPGRTGSSAMASPYWLPFVSNTVAHAIAAGLIKEPHQIGAWAKAAAETAIALEALG